MSENVKVLKALISCDKLISVDRRLEKKRKSRTFRLSWDYEHELRQLEESLRRTSIEQGSFSNDCLYSMLYVFYLKENFMKRDTDNMVKAVTDAISRYLGFNDNRIISFKVSKRMITDYPDENKQEYVYFELERIERKPNDYKIKYQEFTDWINNLIETEKGITSDS